MIKVSIIRDGQITNQASFPTREEADKWLGYHESSGSFGQKKQVLKQQVELFPAVLDEEGKELSPAQYEEQELELPGYEVEVEDLSAKLVQERINAEALAFLAATDYIVIRATERGEELSPEFKAERQAARDRIVK